jgi:hypothetical protein
LRQDVSNVFRLFFLLYLLPELIIAIKVV